MNVENFIGPQEGAEGGGMSLEALQERMRENAAFMAAIKKDEGKQKKDEDQLIKLLVKLIKESQHIDILNLVSRLLAFGVPSFFLVSLLFLIEKEFILNHLHSKNKDKKSLSSEDVLLIVSGKEGEEGYQTSNIQKSLLNIKGAKVLMPTQNDGELQVELKFWLQTMLASTEKDPKKLNELFLGEDKDYMQNLLAGLVREELNIFFDQKNSTNINQDYVENFCGNTIRLLVQKLKSFDLKKLN